MQASHNFLDLPIRIKFSAIKAHKLSYSKIVSILSLRVLILQTD